MKFNKGESYTYFVQTVPEPELLEDIRHRISEYINNTIEGDDNDEQDNR